MAQTRWWSLPYIFFLFRQVANRLVCFFFVFFYHLSSSLAASAVSTLQTSPPAHTQTYINPFKVKLPKSRLSSHLNSFVPLFFRLWKRFSEAVQNSSSLQGFKQAMCDHVNAIPIPICNVFSPNLSDLT